MVRDWSDDVPVRGARSVAQRRETPGSNHAQSSRMMFGLQKVEQFSEHSLSDLS